MSNIYYVLEVDAFNLVAEVLLKANIVVNIYLHGCLSCTLCGFCCCLQEQKYSLSLIVICLDYPKAQILRFSSALI